MKITNTRTVKRNYPEKRITGAKLYIDSNEHGADSIIDEWFNKNEIWKLDFKCKTWSSVKRLGTKAVVAALREKFPTEKISYSVNAGCSCGCSPGYNMKQLTDIDMNNSENWITLEATEDEGDELRELLKTKFLPKLKKEIADQKALNIQIN